MERGELPELGVWAIRSRLAKRELWLLLLFWMSDEIDLALIRLGPILCTMGLKCLEPHKVGVLV